MLAIENEVQYTGNEREVAAILLQLHKLIRDAQRRKRYNRIPKLLASSSWGSKRKRSAIYDGKDDDAVDTRRPPTTPTPLPVAVKPKPRRKYVLKIKIKSKEQLLREIEELTNSNDQLKEEIFVVKVLKAKQQELPTEGVTDGSKKAETAATVFPA